MITINTIAKSVLAAAVMVATISADAQRALESLTLDNNTVFNGYTKQYTTEGNRIFMAETAIYTISADSAEKVLTPMPDIAWNNFDGKLLLFKTSNSELAKKYLNPRGIENVRLKRARYASENSPGVEVVLLPTPLIPGRVSFLVTANKMVTVNENQIALIDYNPDVNAKVGLKDLKQTNDGKRYVGFLMTEVPGKSLTMLTDDGSIVDIHPDSIAVTGYIRIDEDTQLAAQSPWFRTYSFSDALDVKGIASEINYNENTITISRFDSEKPVTMSLDDYKGFLTERNTHQVKNPAPKTDFSQDQVYANGTLLRKLDNIDLSKQKFEIKKADSQLLVTNIPGRDKNGKLSVEFMLDRPGIISIVPLRLAASDSGNPKYIVTRDDINRGITYESRQTGKQGQTVLVYEPLPDGLYLLCIPALDIAYIIGITNK